MTRYLVVYYSWSGTTERVATAVAESLGADVEPIRDVEPTGVLGIVTRGVGSALGMRGYVHPCKKRPEDYDLVVVGMPVWALNVPPSVCAWLERERGGLRHPAGGGPGR